MLDALQYGFMQNALIAGLLASVACGVVGTYIVTKRIVFISGGIAHTSFGGIGLGYLMGFNPVLGALLFSLGAAVGMGYISRRTKTAPDTIIGILWAMGMALGVLFIGLAPGYAPDLFGYLFGNILTVPTSDLWLMLALDVVIVGVVIALYKEFLAISFDEEYSAAMGLPVGLLYLIMLCLVALTVVVLLRVVGMILVLALLTIPVALARQFTYDIKKIMLYASLFGMVFTIGGLWLSYNFDLASGATIILLGGVTLLVYTGFNRLRKTIVNNNKTNI
jgi:zinc transport system permease protein